MSSTLNKDDTLAIEKAITDAKKRYSGKLTVNGYFKPEVFRCKCTACQTRNEPVYLNPSIQSALNHIQDELYNTYYTNVSKENKTLKVSSGVRCQQHNKDEGGTANSYHVLGEAVDIIIPSALESDSALQSFVDIIKKEKVFKCISPYRGNGFIHLDTQSYMWPEHQREITVDNPLNFKDGLPNLPNDTGSTSSASPKLSAADVNEKLGSNSTTDVEVEGSIIDFTQLVVGKNFKKRIGNVFQYAGSRGLGDVLRSFLQELFYNIYCIPNLKNAFCFVVKPETLFTKIPKCNIIFPCMKESISINKLYKQEATRAILVTDTSNMVSVNNQSSPCKKVTIAAYDGKNGFKIMESNINNIEVGKPSTYPTGKLSEYEKKYGSRTQTITGGEVIDTFVNSFISNKADVADSVLNQLAKYELAKMKYTVRNGTIQMYFNPYITPGFPFASMEGIDESTVPATKLNIYGYITSVVHNITDRAWSTTASFTGIYTDDEPMPSIQPVVESVSGYSKSSIDATYKDIFGDNCGTAYDRPAIKSEFKDLLSESANISDAYSCIQRDSCLLSEYFKAVGISATKLADKENYSYINDTNYFRKELQDTIHKYSQQIYKDKLAFHTNDVR